MLARPGWAGSGVSAETWWRTAVFYRLDPARFQDSGGTGKGNLVGLAERLEYLQALGVDALILDGQHDTQGLDDLIRSASEHHLRVLLTLSPAMQAGDRQALLATIHGWLGAGAAGVWVPPPGAQGVAGNGGYAGLVAALNAMLRSFPGGRVLLAGATAPLAGSALPSSRVRRAGGSGLFGGAAGGSLTTVAAFSVQPPSAAALRQSLTAIADENTPAVDPLLSFAGDPRTGAPDAVADATVLLASHGAAFFDFGDEIGLDTLTAVETDHGGVLPVMQWTPANIQQAAPAPIQRAAPGSGQPEYGPYVPYVRPPAVRLTGPPPALPHATVDGNIPPPLPAPDTLPGFTTGKLPLLPIEGGAINVATEDRDPNSVLSAYRALIALHHGNATVRNGAQTVLNRDAQSAVVWVRRAPAGSRTVGNVIVAANLGTQPITLSLDSDLAHLGLHSGPLRALFAFAPRPLTGENTGALQLPPHAVFIGEVVR